MRLIASILLLILLTASPSWAGPAAMRILQVMNGAACSGTIPSGTFTINGQSSFSAGNYETVDSGIQSICSNAGVITIYASCNAASGVAGYVRLYVDSSTNTLNCVAGSSVSQTIGVTTTKGAHNVRVYMTSSGGTASLTASTFTRP